MDGLLGASEGVAQVPKVVRAVYDQREPIGPLDPAILDVSSSIRLGSSER